MIPDLQIEEMRTSLLCVLLFIQGLCTYTNGYVFSCKGKFLGNQFSDSSRIAEMRGYFYETGKDKNEKYIIHIIQKNTIYFESHQSNI